MGERKVLNRYVPADFDPKIIPKFKRDKNKAVEVRTMLPFSIRCETCGEYMGRGKKFNSRKEYCQGEDYMGIRRWRFLIKCCVCSAEISFKTDPQSTDYVCEYGATRNFELWKENDAAKEEEERAREEDEADAMKSLENRTMDSKMEMDVLDALDEIKAMNQRYERVDTESILRRREEAEKAKSEANRGLSTEDEALVKSIRFRSSQPKQLSDDDDSDKESSKPSKTIDIFHAVQDQLASKQKSTQDTMFTVKKKKRKAADDGKTKSALQSGVNNSVSVATSNRPDSGETSPKKVKTKVSDSNALGGLMMGYGSSDSD